MTKKSVLISLVLGTVLFTGCGGGSSNEDSETKTAPLSNQGQEIVDKSKNDSPDLFEHQENIGKTKECVTSGKTVLVDEGTTCKHSATSATISCKDNKVTLSGMTAKEINIFGYKYICQ